MIRKLFLVPAFALAATLFASESAQAQIGRPLPGPGGPGGLRPLPGPVGPAVVRPLPGPVGPVVVRPQPGPVVVRPLPGPVGPVVVRPLPSPVIVRPSPVVVRPAPSINIGLTFGAPIHTYSVYTPPVVISEPVCNHFRVVFRASCQEPWRTYKIYHSPQMAREVAEEFAYLGYEAAVYSE